MTITVFIDKCSSILTIYDKICVFTSKEKRDLPSVEANSELTQDLYKGKEKRKLAKASSVHAAMHNSVI